MSTWRLLFGLRSSVHRELSNARSGAREAGAEAARRLGFFIASSLEVGAGEQVQGCECQGVEVTTNKTQTSGAGTPLPASRLVLQLQHDTDTPTHKQLGGDGLSCDAFVSEESTQSLQFPFNSLLKGYFHRKHTRNCSVSHEERSKSFFVPTIVGEQSHKNVKAHRSAVGRGGLARCDQANRLRDFCCPVTTFTGLFSRRATLLQVSMDLLQNSSQTMWSLNTRLRGFLEQVNQLQEANRRLEAQIANWGMRSTSRSQDWSQQEQTVKELRAQVGKLLMENAQLALQSDIMKSRAAAIQARCEIEEDNNQHLEHQVALLRESKTKAEQSGMTLQAEIHRSMTELQEIHQQYEAVQALQLQRVDSCNALLATDTAAGGEEDDGTGMELIQLLDRIRAQCEQSRLPGPSERHLGLGTGSHPLSSLVGPSCSGAGAAAAASSPHRGALSEEEAAWEQVSLGGAALREARAELSEARKQWHSLQVEIETLHALEKGLESSLQHTQQMYSNQLQDLSQVIARLESELEQVRGGLATQRQRHSQLLNTKMRLEREIATYRRLLEREEGRYMGHNGRPMSLRPWRSSTVESGVENGLSDPVVTPDEPKSEPLPEIPSLLPAENGLQKSILHRQQSLVILTEPEQDKDLPICTVKTQEILQGHVVRESAEGHGTIETEKIDKVIKQWEGSFFRGNPKLRKKSVSLRFDLHMAAADEGCGQTKQDSLPDVEVRLVMKRSRSIPSITQ